jgi:hypothetical protein
MVLAFGGPTKVGMIWVGKKSFGSSRCWIDWVIKRGGTRARIKRSWAARSAGWLAVVVIEVSRRCWPRYRPTLQAGLQCDRCRAPNHTHQHLFVSALQIAGPRKDRVADSSRGARRAAREWKQTESLGEWPPPCVLAGRGAGYRPCSARSALRLSSAARGGWESGRSG